MWPEKLRTSAKPTEEERAKPTEVSRRDFIRGGLAVGTAAGLSASGLLALHSRAHAQIAQQIIAAPADKPVQSQGLWPSRWGPNDQAGASNWITPEKIRQAARMIQSGKTYEIGRVYESGMPVAPAAGHRRYEFHIPGAPIKPTGGPYGQNGLVFNDDFLSTEIGQVGTQFDGLGHIGIQMGPDGDTSQMYLYNGRTMADILAADGLRALGIENVRPIFTRGILIDVAALHGGALKPGYEITAGDVSQALRRQRIPVKTLAPGDAYFFHTGHGRLWMVDNETYASTMPGIGLDVAGWLIAQGASVVGTDTLAVEVVPNPDPKLAFPVHQELIVKNGIFLHENLDLSSLAAERVYEFVYNFSPIRFKGGTGSPGRPIAMT